MEHGIVLRLRNHFRNTPKRYLYQRKILAVLGCLFMFCGVSQAIEQEYALHVGPNGYAPFAMIDRANDQVRYYGVMFDFLDAFEAEHPEFKRKAVLLTRKRANAQMAKGEMIDIMLNSPLFVSAKIKKHYKFTDTFLHTEDKVISRKGEDFSYKTPADLHGKTVGTIRGYSYGEFDYLIKNGVVQDIRVDHHTQAIGMLSKNRIDAYFGNRHVTPLYIKELGLSIDDFVFSETSLYEFDVAFAVNLKRPVLYQKLNSFLQRYIASGLLDKLMRSYIE